MTLMLCIIAFIVGIVVTLFVNGVFPLKETIEEIWRSKTIASAVLLGLIGTVGIFQHWTMITALCVFGLCGMVVLTKFLAKDEVKERITDAQFWIEVRLKEQENLVGKKFEEIINALDDMLEDVPDKDKVNALLREESSKILKQLEDGQEPRSFFVTADDMTKAEPKDGGWVIHRDEDSKDKGKAREKKRNGKN